MKKVKKIKKIKKERPTTYEFKHVKCSVDYTQTIIEHHQLFFWEMMGTNTIVSKESHLEDGGIFDSDGTIYSVTTAERFTTVDFRRNKDIPHLSEVKSLESRYFSIISRLERMGLSALNDYRTQPAKEFSEITFIVLLCFFVYPGIWYYRKKNEEYEKLCDQWRSLRAERSSLVNDNQNILNV